jgi:hypothetical protein
MFSTNINLYWNEFIWNSGRFPLSPGIKNVGSLQTRLYNRSLRLPSTTSRLDLSGLGVLHLVNGTALLVQKVVSR